jgi:hypothetical protein
MPASFCKPSAALPARLPRPRDSRPLPSFAGSFHHGGLAGAGSADHGGKPPFSRDMGDRRALLVRQTIMALEDRTERLVRNAVRRTTG